MKTPVENDTIDDKKKNMCAQLYDAEAVHLGMQGSVLKLKAPPDIHHNTWQFAAPSVCLPTSLS